MKGQVIDRISQNGLLDQKDIASGGNDLFDEGDDVLSFLFQNSIHSSVVIDNNIVL